MKDKKKTQFSVGDIKKLAQDYNKGCKFVAESDYPEEVIDAVIATAKAYKTLENAAPLKPLTERLRENPVGAIINVNGVNTIATNRGIPHGFVAAVSDGENVYVGVSYPNKDEKYVLPQVGAAVALERAIEAKEKKDSTIPSVKNQDKKQLTHFVKRAMAYFMPDKYSFSRGKTPVDYFDEKLHERQVMLGFKS